MPELTHLVSLQAPAGVELHFSAFLRRAAARHPQWTHRWLNAERGLHAEFERSLAGCLAGSAEAKYRWGIKLPAVPAWPRKLNCRRALAGSDLLLIWNRSSRIGYAVDAAGAERCVHWEHGAAWFGGRERERRRYLRRVPLAIANSTAAARVLQLFWDYRGPSRICPNGLRPSLAPPAPLRKDYPQGRPIRFGTVARLNPVKGVALAVHAVKRLCDGGMDAELHIAGAGQERDRLERLAERLGIAPRVRFRGRLAEMRRFYEQMDCLLHPALSEAFGLLAIEAAAHGCPVIAAGIDGLPESVADGVSGYVVATSLPLSDYPALGGVLERLPAFVYDPYADRLVEPRLVDPAKLADAARRLFGDADAYRRLSASASRHALGQFGFDRHVDDVIDVLGERLARI